MRPVPLALLVLFSAGWMPLRAPGAQQAPSFHLLSSPERAEIGRAARLAAHSRREALLWLNGRSNVRWVGLGPDGQTIEIRFHDGAVGAVFHVSRSNPSPGPDLPGLTARLLSRANTPSRALVLEPFASQLALGPTAGTTEVDALRQAGFQVDVYRDDAVTIPVVEGMASYSVVYMESHSGECGPPLCKGNDVFVLTGAEVPSDVNQYAPLFLDGSMTEGVTDTQPGILYLAFTSRLISLHLHTFPHSSLVFINGCDVLETPDLLQALLDHGASSVYSWNKRVYNFDAEAAADFLFQRLAAGDTVSTALKQARSDGLGTSLADQGSSLQLFGDPDNTLAGALNHATPTITPTPAGAGTATATPAPARTPGAGTATHAATCKKGYKRVKGKCRKAHRKT